MHGASGERMTLQAIEAGRIATCACEPLVERELLEASGSLICREQHRRDRRQGNLSRMPPPLWKRDSGRAKSRATTVLQCPHFFRRRRPPNMSQSTMKYVTTNCISLSGESSGGIASPAPARSARPSVPDRCTAATATRQGMIGTATDKSARTPKATSCMWGELMQASTWGRA